MSAKQSVVLVLVLMTVLVIIVSFYSARGSLSILASKVVIIDTEIDTNGPVLSRENVSTPKSELKPQDQVRE